MSSFTPSAPSDSASANPGKTTTVADIVTQVKIQGVFDKFRRDCLAVAETRPNYKRLKESVRRDVQSHLRGIRWTPSLSKNAVRDRIREKLQNAFFLQNGIHWLIKNLLTNDQINGQFKPEIDQIARQCLGLDSEGSSSQDASKATTSDHKHSNHQTTSKSTNKSAAPGVSSSVEGGREESGPDDGDQGGAGVESVEQEDGWLQGNSDLRMGVSSLIEQPPAPPSSGGVEEEVVVEPLDMDVDEENASNYIEYIDPSDPKTQFTYLDADGMEILECLEDGEPGTAVVLDSSVLSRMMEGLEEHGEYPGGDSAKASVGSSSNSPSRPDSPFTPAEESDATNMPKTVCFTLTAPSPPPPQSSPLDEIGEAESRDEAIDQSDRVIDPQAKESASQSDAESDDFEFDFQVETEGGIEPDSASRASPTEPSNSLIVRIDSTGGGKGPRKHKKSEKTEHSKSRSEKKKKDAKERN